MSVLVTTTGGYVLGFTTVRETYIEIADKMITERTFSQQDMLQAYSLLRTANVIGWTIVCALTFALSFVAGTVLAIPAIYLIAVAEIGLAAAKDHLEMTDV
jgi:hypothetical protein